MKLVHNILVTAFCREGESLELITSAMRRLLPSEVIIKQQTAFGFNEKRIKVLSVTLDKEKLVNAFLKNLASSLTGEQMQLLVSQKQSRLDDELHFFIRLDKESLFSKEYRITDSGSCIHIRMSIAAFPKKRAVALSLIDQLFG